MNIVQTSGVGRQEDRKNMDTRAIVSCQDPQYTQKEGLVNIVQLRVQAQVYIYHCKKTFTLTIALSSELQPTDVVSCIATTVLLLQYY